MTVWLNRIKLHLNHKGTSILSDNLFNILKIWPVLKRIESHPLKIQSKNVKLGYININSIRNKIEGLKSFLSDADLDVFAFAETKIDESFPTSQFLIPSYKSPFRHDVTNRSGGLLVYVNSAISARQWSVPNIAKDIQVVIVELLLKKSRWLVVSIYRPPSQNLEYFLDSLSNISDFSSFKDCVII